MKNTIVISAFPACGKTYAFENYQDTYSILDSDSSLFSWIRDENGESTGERNPNFINDYILHIKNNLGKVDYIFVSSHKDIRSAMTDSSIEFYTIYPKKMLLNEWVGRMYRRGNDSKFIQNIIDGWDAFMAEIEHSNLYGNKIYRLDRNEYINQVLLYHIAFDAADSEYIIPKSVRYGKDHR